MKKFNGKAIYPPSGKAGEYAEYACNFYVGCSNGCEYCYCKKGILAPVMGQNEPQLKKCFRDEDNALEIFETEMKANLPELQKHGLFFSFTTDPMLPETFMLTLNAMNACHCCDIPVTILTKCTWWVDKIISAKAKYGRDSRQHKLTAIGFTLTGHDELEPNASTNAERIEAMKKLCNAGFKTFASIEPIIDFDHSKYMIENTIGWCHLYKIGVESGRKYHKKDLQAFVEWALRGSVIGLQPKYYFKDSLLKQSGIDRSTLPANCVGRDYNIFLKRLKKMDAKELMIGNIVDIKYRIHDDVVMTHARVTGISDTTISVEFDKDGRRHKWDLNPAGVSPVLLTEEILLENGFVERGEFLVFPGQHAPLIKKKKEHEERWVVKNSRNVDFFSLIDCVHELQNLFFIRTGQWLRMKNLTAAGICGETLLLPWYPSDDGMKAYVGAKIIAAKPMSRHDYLFDYLPHHPREARRDKAAHRNLARCPQEEDIAGYLVRYPDGYESWSPAHIFEECYREISDREKNLQR